MQGIGGIKGKTINNIGDKIFKSKNNIKY